jgi:hypothetical protein
MLVWSEDNLEEFCEGQCDLPPLFSFAALNLDNSLMQKCIHCQTFTMVLYRLSKMGKCVIAYNSL